jgi:amino acid adenylation domain-containing protein
MTQELEVTPNAVQTSRFLLPELFSRQAARTPHATALVDGAEILDYAETARRVDGLAHRLREHGVGHEVVVAIDLPRSVDVAVCLLAVAKAGGAFLLVDREYPAERRRQVLAAAAVRVVLTTEDSDGPWTALRPDRISGSVSLPEPGIRGDNAAYIVFTSGSTGIPKGVVNTHRGLANRLLDAVNRHRLGHGDRLLQTTRAGFDPAVFQILVPLVSGGAVVFPPEGVERDPAELARLMAEHRITAVELVPSLLRMFLAEPGAAAVTSLRWLTSAGEALHSDLCERALAVLGVPVWNVYGPAECAIGATDHRYDPAQQPGAVPLGRPIDDVRLSIRDAHGDPAADGEIYLGGPNLARGYLGPASLTAERFLPDPDGPPGARCYRTGDLARITADGDVEFAGRADNQVKLNGVRVEPEEIEAVLAAHPRVHAAVVVPRPDRAGNVRMVAFVQGLPAPDELRAYLRTRFPESHLPSIFQQVDEIPLTANGKVDRHALTVTTDTARPPYRPPRTPLEHLVVQVWSDVLGVEHIGMDDDFFQLGGYSLLLIRVAAKLRSLGGRPVAVRQLFTASTPAAQAGLIDGRGTSSPVIKPAARDGRLLPLSFPQQQLWVLDQLNPASPEYTMPIALRLPGTGIEPATIKAVLADLAARHEVLRTRYRVINDQPTQVIDESQHIELTIVHVRPDELMATVARQFARGFDLAHGPVWRAMLAEVDGQQSLLLLTIHHIACDGWSVVTLHREFEELYAAYTAGRAANLPARDLQYADFAVWQHEHATGGALDEQLAYWRDKLAGVPNLDLPTDRPHPPIRDPRGAAFGFTVPTSVVRSVLRTGRRHGATPFMTLLAGFVALLARYSGQTDIPVGSPFSGRLREEVAGMVGCFLNTVVLRCSAGGNPTFTELLDGVRDTVIAAQAAQEVPFERLVHELVPDHDRSRNPLAQVLFDLHDDGVSSITDDVEGLWMLLDAWRGAKAELNLTVEIRPDGSCAAVLEYSTALFDAVTVHRLAEHYVQLLSCVAADPETRLSNLELLSSYERDMVLAEGNRTVADRPPLAIHETFARQAAATPEAVALVAGERTVTYGELDLLSDQLAARLHGLGLGPECVVGVCLDRGIDLIMSFLGIWKAGAAYLPLDPSFPRERLAYLAGDAGTRFVLTQRAHAGLLDGVVPLLLDTPAERAELAAQPPYRPGRADLDSLAYVMYTSGSTGAPKGVLIDHRGLQNYLMWTVEGYAGAETGGTPLFSSTAYDMVVPDIYTALVMGQPVHLLPPNFEPTELGRLLARSGPFSFIKLTPGHLDLLCDQLSPAEAESLAGTLVVGADALPVTVLRRWQQVAGERGPRLLNEYGPTEISVANSTFPIDGADLADTVPIGRPIPNTTMYVLDDYGNPVPVGVPGELYVGGVGVARGYLNKPSLTARSFVPDPFSGEPGGRLYRTGDRARLRADGNVEFLGRTDDQIKLRGYRVEPAEIESALTARADVRDALVLAEGTGVTRRLVAYVVPEANCSLDAELLRDHCARQLPAHLVPASFVRIDRIPLNANGKVQRSALPAPPEPADDHRGPADELEHALSTIWRDLLGLESEVDVRRNFFQLGGNSILAARLVSRIEAVFGIRLSLRAVFEHPTITDIAQRIEQRIRDEIAELSEDELRSLTTSDREGSR